MTNLIVMDTTDPEINLTDEEQIAFTHTLGTFAHEDGEGAKDGKDTVYPITMAPAARSLATLVPSIRATCPNRNLLPQSVGRPAISMLSLIVTGIPASGPASGRIVSAVSKASCSYTSTKALMRGFTWTVRSKCSSIRKSGVVWRFRTWEAISTREIGGVTHHFIWLQ